MQSKILQQLYAKYHKEIYLYLFSLCHNRELAEDLMQETFLKALLSLSDSHTNVRAWLYLVARNLYFNHQNREKKVTYFDDIEETFGDAQTDEVLQRLLLDERRKLLYQALQHLGKQKRELLTLQYFGGMSQKEIATLLKITPENVRVLAYRSKKELKKYMEDNHYDLS